MSDGREDNPLVAQPENRAKLGIVDGFIRLSVGIEDYTDLRADLERAFHAAR